MEGEDRSLRVQMPEIASWIDSLRDAFGLAEVNAQIRRGLAGEPVFWAREGGHEVGCRSSFHGSLTVDEVLALSAAAERWLEFEASRWPKESP